MAIYVNFDKRKYLCLVTIMVMVILLGLLAAEFITVQYDMGDLGIGFDLEVDVRGYDMLSENTADADFDMTQSALIAAVVFSAMLFVAALLFFVKEIDTTYITVGTVMIMLACCICALVAISKIDENCELINTALAEAKIKDLSFKTGIGAILYVVTSIVGMVFLTCTLIFVKEKEKVKAEEV